MYASTAFFLSLVFSFGAVTNALANDEFTEDEPYYASERQRNNGFIFGKFADNGHIIHLNHPPFFPNDSTPVPRIKVFYWELARARFRGEITESRFLTDASRKFMGGDDTLLFFVPETEQEDLTRFQRQFGRAPDGFLKGIQVSGRLTVEVRDPARPRKRFSLKFAKKLEKPEGGHVRALGGPTIERSVKMSDIFYEILRTEGPGGRVGTYPETFGVYYDNWGWVLREHEAVGLDVAPGTGWEVPLHALLSAEAMNLDLLAIVKAYAERHAPRRGISSPSHWIINEFIPVMASGLAQLLLMHGIVAELHTQNIKLILEIDPRRHVPTGRILGFIFIDACDGAIDPAVRVLFNRHLFMAELAHMGNRSVMGERVMGETMLADHANHLNAFFSQVLSAVVFHSLPNKVTGLTTPGYLESWEHDVYKKFLSDFLAAAEVWFNRAKLPHAPMLGYLRALLANTYAIDPSHYALASNYGERKVFPTRGAVMMRVAAQVISQVVTSQITATLSAARQRPFLIYDGLGKSISSLKFKFLEARSYRRVAYLRVEDSTDESWIHDRETDFWSIEEVGIVAFRWVEVDGNKVPMPIAIAAPSTPLLTATECAALIVDGVRFVRDNRSLPELAEMVRAIDAFERITGGISRRLPPPN